MKSECLDGGLFSVLLFYSKFSQNPGIDHPHSDFGWDANMAGNREVRLYVYVR